jgi:hypothetical protein
VLLVTAIASAKLVKHIPRLAADHGAVLAIIPSTTPTWELADAGFEETRSTTSGV